MALVIGGVTPPPPRDTSAASSATQTVVKRTLPANYVPPSISNAKDFTRNNGVKIVVYGSFDAGKTWQIGTLRRPFVISTEQGLLSVAGREGIDYIAVKTIDDLLYVKLQLEAGAYANYETICLDSISDIAETVLANEIDSHKNKMAAYGSMQEIVIDLLKLLRSTAQNVYITAWSTAFGDNAYGEARPYVPSKKLPNILPHFFDEIFHLAVHNVADANGNTVPMRFFQTQSFNNVMARDRSTALAAFEPANLQDVFDKIHAHTAQITRG